MNTMQINLLAVMVADTKELREQCDEIFKLSEEFSDVTPAYDNLLNILARGIETSGVNDLQVDLEFNKSVIDEAAQYKSIGVFSYCLRCANRAIERHVIQSLDLDVRYTSLLQLNAVIFAALEAASRDTAKKIANILLHSALTGLRNKTAFDLDLKNHMAKGQPIHIVYIDMDGLKTLNDSEGHAAGNEALCKLGVVLSTSMRDGQSCYHFSGDEFGVADVGNSIDTLTQQLVEINAIAKNKFSFGIATWPEESDSIDAVINKADLNMQSQKKIRRANGQAAERGAAAVAVGAIGG